MKIAMAQIEIVPGRPDLNFIKIKEYVDKAKAENANMVIFPELAVPGYLIGDMWEEKAFLKDVTEYNREVQALAKDIHIVFGTIAVDFENNYSDGRPIIHNVMYYVDAKMGAFRVTKALLPNYREFEEPRHFQSAVDKYDLKNRRLKRMQYFMPIEVDKLQVGFCLCEDGWDQDYQIKPIKELIVSGAELIINISCSPYTCGKNRSRNRVFGEGHAKQNNVPLIYVNAVGIQNNGKTIYTFDGSSVAYGSDGTIMAQAPMFQEAMVYVNYNTAINDICLTNSFQTKEKATNDIAEIAEALKYGIKKYLEQIGTKKVVIGISGGIDSAVAASLYAQVIGPENLLLVNMPSKYNSVTTKNIASTIAFRIGCYYTEIPIEKSIALTDEQINHLVVKNARVDEADKVLTLTPFHFENIQARDRSSRILSALSCAWGGVFTNNGNKAETTVGYATLYGDVAGYLAAIGDLWKHQVYELGRYLNETYPVLPDEVFNIVASAELSDNQNVDEGKGDPIIYWYHDKLFASWVEDWYRKTPEDNLRSYIDGTINIDLKIEEGKTVYALFTPKAFVEDLERWYKLFKGMGVAKRVQAPPILAVSRRAFGFDYRESMGCCYFTREYLKLKERLLNEKANKE